MTRRSWGYSTLFYISVSCGKTPAIGGGAPRNATIIQPTKKTRGKEFTADQKTENEAISPFGSKLGMLFPELRSKE